MCVEFTSIATMGSQKHIEKDKKTSTFLNETKETEKQGVSPWVCGEWKGCIRQLVDDDLLI